MQCKVMTITPAMARDMLLLNTKNRRLNESHVKHLANEIKQRRWKLNGDAIRFSGNQLLDGQHRLNAIIQANVPVDSVVIDGIEGDVFDTIDIGNTRSASDLLSIHGEKNTTLLAAALKIIAQHRRGVLAHKPKISHCELEEVLIKNPGIRNSVSFCERHPAKRIISKAVYAAFHYLFSEANPELADRFWLSIANGTQLIESNASHLLRERLIRNALSKEKISRNEVISLVIRAWNHTIDANQIKALRGSCTKGKEGIPAIKTNSIAA